MTGKLHFRIFDGDGEVVVDTDEKSLTEQTRQVEGLREQLKSLRPLPVLTRSEKDGVITAVTSIVGPSRKYRCFTYLQGIDGRLPNGPAAESKRRQVWRPNEECLARRRGAVVSPQVQAFGRSQVDYIPRLVAQMKAQAGKRDWAAIGVLGSDLYDKIMLIEVLRHDFPEALIFTTDMDARYLDTDKHDATRNLIVGSHYGLELNERLQGAIPAFRSVYQTSLFFGCLKALYD